jgi:glycosyltransferase involved in cell wall biosynthesis
MIDKRLRIMQVTHDLGIGGLPRVVADICKHIDKTRFDISVSCLRGLGEYAEELEENGIKVYRVPPSKNNKVDYLSFLKLHGLLRGKGIDILHTHNIHPFIDGTLAGKMGGIPVNIHTDHARDFPDKRRYMLAERILSHFVEKIVAVSEATKQKLISYEKIKADKITVIRNGIDHEKFNVRINQEEKKKELGAKDCYPILGIGVRLAKQKGIIYLLNALPKIVREFPKLMLLIAGYGEEENELKQEVVKLGIDHHVRFLGPRLDMPEILSILDVYVLPSIWEGLPLVVLEAMAARKPIVATAVDGTKEAVIHGHSGLLVPPQNPGALAEAILQVSRDKALALFLAKNAYNRFLEHFTVRKMVSRYEELYLTCYDNKFKTFAT